MTRRSLLTMLASAATAAAADPERLLWTPGRKLISIPPPKTLADVVHTGWIQVGDILTFGKDPMQWRVTEVALSHISIKPRAL